MRTIASKLPLISMKFFGCLLFCVLNLIYYVFGGCGTHPSLLDFFGIYQKVNNTKRYSLHPNKHFDNEIITLFTYPMACSCTLYMVWFKFLLGFCEIKLIAIDPSKWDGKHRPRICNLYFMFLIFFFAFKILLLTNTSQVAKNYHFWFLC